MTPAEREHRVCLLGDPGSDLLNWKRGGESRARMSNGMKKKRTHRGIPLYLTPPLQETAYKITHFFALPQPTVHNDYIDGGEPVRTPLRDVGIHWYYMGLVINKQPSTDVLFFRGATS